MDIGDFKKLKAWQKARELNKEVYLITKLLPKEELFALTDQIRRCVNSIPANIAEGHGRGSVKEMMHFLTISKGSLCELESHLILASDIGYLNEDILKPIYSLIVETSRLINGLYDYKRRQLQK